MIVIVDYGMGNVGSVKNALTLLGAEVVISNKKADIEQSTHIILPGVGAFGDGMRRLRESSAIGVLRREVLEKKKPFLGVCLGMQLLATKGDEGGIHEGLGWIPGNVRRFDIDENKFRVPHIGWNDVVCERESSLFSDISSPVFYFVHSYIFVPSDAATVTARCEYGEPFAAAVEMDNIRGVQFHPEKSQKSGLTLLCNFIGAR